MKFKEGSAKKCLKFPTEVTIILDLSLCDTHVSTHMDLQVSSSKLCCVFKLTALVDVIPGQYIQIYMSS